MSDIVVYRNLKIDFFNKNQLFDPETLRVVGMQMEFLGSVVPQLTYKAVMAWEGFFLNPRPDMLEKVQISKEELQWIVVENVEQRDRLLAWPLSCANLFAVPEDNGTLCLVVAYWKDNHLTVGKVSLPVTEEHWLYRDFTHYQVITRNSTVSDCRWK